MAILANGVLVYGQEGEAAPMLRGSRVFSGEEIVRMWVEIPPAPPRHVSDGLGPPDIEPGVVLLETYTVRGRRDHVMLFLNEKFAGEPGAAQRRLEALSPTLALQSQMGARASMRFFDGGGGGGSLGRPANAPSAVPISNHLVRQLPQIGRDIAGWLEKFNR